MVLNLGSTRAGVLFCFRFLLKVRAGVGIGFRFGLYKPRAGFRLGL